LAANKKKGKTVGLKKNQKHFIRFKETPKKMRIKIKIKKKIKNTFLAFSCKQNSKFH